MHVYKEIDERRILVKIYIEICTQDSLFLEAHINIYINIYIYIYIYMYSYIFIFLYVYVSIFIYSYLYKAYRINRKSSKRFD